MEQNVSPPSFYLFYVVAVEGPIHKLLKKGKKVCDKIKKKCFSICHSLNVLVLVTTTTKQKKRNGTDQTP
jgi:hypothetical protein